MSTETVAPITTLVDELKSEKTFDARKAITGATYPVDSIDVFSDAQLAHELNVVANEAAKARHLADSLSAFARGGMTDDPAYEEADAEATDLEAEVANAVKAIKSSVLTYHLRGLAPVQWRLIDKKWRKEIKAPARKNYPDTAEGEEEFEVETHERNRDRNNSINHDLIASSIIKVTNAEGAADTSVWKHTDVAALFDTYLESEYTKLLNMMQQLTFANNVFAMAVEQDADFLPKP